jgi:hypothetical protein
MNVEGSSMKWLVAALVAVIIGLVIGLIIVGGDDGGGSDTVTIDTSGGITTPSATETQTEPTQTGTQPGGTTTAPGTGGTTVPGAGL